MVGRRRRWRRRRTFCKGEFDTNLAVGAARWAAKLQSFYQRPKIRVLIVKEAIKGDAGGADEGLGCLRGFRVEDVYGQIDLRKIAAAFFNTTIREGQRGKHLVPDGFDTAGVVGLGGGAAVGINIGDDVGLQIAVPPVDVLQMLSGDDCDFEIQRRTRRQRWR